SSAQSQTSALTDRLGRIKRIKNTLRVTNSWPGIREFQHYVIAFQTGTQSEHASAGFMQSIGGVANNFQTATEELVGIPPNRWGTRRNTAFHAYVLAFQAKHFHLQRTLGKGTEIHQGLFARGLLGETEKPGNQLLSAPRLLLYFARHVDLI